MRGSRKVGSSRTVEDDVQLAKTLIARLLEVHPQTVRYWLDTRRLKGQHISQVIEFALERKQNPE
jgi:hypothetical protein